MAEKKKPTKAGATELSEEELKKAQGGWSWGETNTSTHELQPVNKSSPLGTWGKKA